MWLLHFVFTLVILLYLKKFFHPHFTLVEIVYHYVQLVDFFCVGKRALKKSTVMATAQMNPFHKFGWVFPLNIVSEM